MRTIHGADAFSIPAGHLEELGLHRSRAERCHRDPVMSQLHAECLAEAGHIGFSGGIHCHLGKWKESGHRADIQDRRRNLQAQHREQQVRQVSERSDIHLQHRGEAFPLGIIKRPQISETGIIDQESEGNLLPDDPGGETLPFGGKSKVGLEGIEAHLRGALLKRGRQFVQPLLATPHQNEARGHRCQLACKLSSEARRGAGDQGRSAPDGKG